MKEYTIIANCNLTNILVEDDADVESIIKSDIYKILIRNIIKVILNADGVDITDVKVFVRDLDSEESEKDD